MLRRKPRQRPKAASVTTHTVRPDAYRGPVERRPVSLERYLLLLCGPVDPKDPAYLAWIRTLPCLTKGCGRGDVEAHHEPPKGMGGAEPDDRNATPLCTDCHRTRTDHHEGWEAVRDACLAARLPCVLAYYCGPEGPGRESPLI